jgi:peptide/nickel transport system ATP-binding protein
MDHIDQVILPQPALDDALSRPPLKTPLDPPILFKHPGVTVDYPLQKGFWGKPKAWLTAVDQVPVSIRRGECLAVVGESGSGKSTLGRAIADLMGNAKGKAVYIDQHPDAALNPSMTVGTALSEMVRHFTPNLNPTEAKAQALQLLQSVGLEAAHYDRLPQALSGGQKQRVCIARALSAAPTLLICDEILSGLDTDNQTAVLQLLSQLRTTHDLTLLFITHDLSVVATFADRVMVLYKGKLEEQGPVKQVFAHPKSAYTQLLLGARL